MTWLPCMRARPWWRSRINFDDKSVLVVDSGLYIHVARRLAESFGRVYYFCPWVGNGFPSEKQRQIGTGIEGIERVYEMWSTARRADLIVFTDIYYHDEQAQLRLMGKRVFGSGYAGGIEIHRGRLRERMEQIGMDVLPYEMVVGEDALREYLEDKDEAWIKASVTRGDFETLHWRGSKLSLPELNESLRRMGPRAKDKEFLVEPNIEGIEVGYEPYCIDGKFGSVALLGYEDKDAGYLGAVLPFEDLSDAVKLPTLALSSTMGDLGCRGFFSNEIRVPTPEAIELLRRGYEIKISDGAAFLIDPCMRCGSPPSESYIELFENWDEVIWYGAEGEVVDLDPVAKYAAQIVLKSHWVTEDYLPVFYPDEVERWVKLHNYCLLDGVATIMPQSFPEFGSAIGLGDTREEAAKNATDVVKQIECIDLEWEHDVFEKIDEMIKEGEKLGVEFP